MIWNHGNMWNNFGILRPLSGEKSRRARTGGTDAGAASYASHLRERSSRFANTDIKYRQSRITAIMSSCDLDLDVWPVTGAVGHRFQQRFPAKRFFRRSEFQCAMRAVGVVPCRKRIKPSLNAAGRRRHERQPLPELQRSKKSFHPAVCQHCQMHSIRQVKRNVCG